MERSIRNENTPKSSYETPSGSSRESKMKEWRQFALFCLIALLVRCLLITPCRVPSGSMLPTLQVGDFPILFKPTYGWSRYSFLGGGYINYFSGTIGGNSMPKRGHVVVFTCPYNTTQDFIKRVVGVPGDKVQMIDGIFHLNGKPIDLKLNKTDVTQYDGHKTVKGSTYTATLPTEGGTVQYEIFKQLPFGASELDHTPEYTVPSDHFFVIGDNPDGSGDSRDVARLGFIHKKYLIGSPLFTYLSIDLENIYWSKPWTWLLLPFKIRWNRCGYQRIQPVFTPNAAESVQKDDKASESIPSSNPIPHAQT